MKIYVGNLSYDTTEEDLHLAFKTFGKVISAIIIKDKFSGQAKGFAFVEMSSTTEGQAAIEGMNGKELKGRELNVNEARPRTESFRGGNTGGFSGSQRGEVMPVVEAVKENLAVEVARELTVAAKEDTAVAKEGGGKGGYGGGGKKGVGRGGGRGR